MRVLIPLCLLSFCTACGTTEIIEKPVPVEVEVVKWVPVPKDLTREVPKRSIPTALTYGQAIELWSMDRASLETANARLRAIQGLSDETPE